MRAPSRTSLSIVLSLALLAAPFATGCGGGRGEKTSGGHDHDHEHGHDEHGHSDDHGHDHGDEHEGHHHAAPHGGTLVLLGDHFAHLEIVLDPTTGALTAYALDGEAENSIRLAQESLALSIDLIGDGADTLHEVALLARANELTGETAGDTSEFHGAVEALVGAEKFKAKIARIEIKGQTLEGVEFAFPDGNE